MNVSPETSTTTALPGSPPMSESRAQRSGAERKSSSPVSATTSTPSPSLAKEIDNGEESADIGVPGLYSGCQCPDASSCAAAPGDQAPSRDQCRGVGETGELRLSKSEVATDGRGVALRRQTDVGSARSVSGGARKVSKRRLRFFRPKGGNALPNGEDTALRRPPSPQPGSSAPPESATRWSSCWSVRSSRSGVSEM